MSIDLSTKEAIAAALNGSEYPLLVPSEVRAAAKAGGFVIVYGQSDDLMEFEGAFDDEIGAYDGTTALIDRQGVLDRSQIDDEDDDAIADFVNRRRSARTIRARWCEEADLSWSYETDIPHATFEVVECGDLYCRGIVIDTRDLPEAA